MKEYYIYILTCSYNTTLYIGVTNDLKRRIYEHKTKVVEGFTSKYNLSKLVYYEIMTNVETALNREKVLKKWSRKKKDKLIEGFNPYWEDLSEKIYM